MGLSSIEENKTTCCLSPKIYQPASEDMDDLLECPRKKKMFSSSSFYEEPNAIYPTVEEQVRLCRKIAESLSDDCNMKSKGANMFFKRVKKAEKWIVAESSAKEEDNTSDSQKDPTKMPYVRPNKGLPKLKLILDPRHLVDMKRLLKEGVDIVEHNAVSPEICHDIVKDLNSPKGKGGQLFAKRKKKSEEWVVDEEKVRTLLHTRYPGYSSPEPPVEPLVHPRVKELSGVNSQDIAESVIRAAEAKIMTYPNAVPQVPVIECLDRPDSSAGSQLQTPLLANQYQKPNPWSSDAYKCRLPKGWTSSTTSSSILVQDDAFAVKESQITTFVPTAQPLMKSATTSKLFNFTNFNASPKAWSPELPQHFRPSSIKPVRPPSVLVQ